MKCPKCKCQMEPCEHFEEEYHSEEKIIMHWRLYCPKCHHYSIAMFTYQVTNIEMEWD